jgi:Cof subfamily protein (haloacid dehalogenase superfamily)
MPISSDKSRPYKIVFFDIDGTLIDEDKKIPPDTIQSIQKLKDANIKVMLATGRSPYHLKPIAEQLGIDSYISFNGSIVVHQGKLIFEQSIPAQSLQFLDQLAHKSNHPLVCLGDQGYYASHESHPHIMETFESLNIALPQYNPHFWRQSKIYQVMLYCQIGEESDYLSYFSDMKFIRWHALSVDVIPSAASKAQGVECILNHLGISPSEAVAFGDALNDREMLSFVGMGIAMGNAHKELIPFSRFITKHVNDGGIQYGLEQIGLI